MPAFPFIVFFINQIVLTIGLGVEAQAGWRLEGVQLEGVRVSVRCLLIQTPVQYLLIEEAACTPVLSPAISGAGAGS